MISVCRMLRSKARAAAGNDPLLSLLMLQSTSSSYRLNFPRMTARRGSSLASVKNVLMIDASQYVPANAFDVLLTDLSAEEISKMKIDGQRHLSPATGEVPSILQGITLGENARVLVRACVSRPLSSTRSPLLNVIMLVDTGSPYVFFTEKTWEALGVQIEDFPGGQASVVINGTKVLGHVSHNHFSDIDVLGASFLKQRQLVVDYTSEIAKIT
mmetsp:Transcript_6185/g.8908  ORF Transcript_6185/g.8908 Transcript_6185/m.8908 type:complete len:214 (-) Transcript_6185:835-1476(-)